MSEIDACSDSILQVTGRGVVLRLHPDDTKGSRHQRFVVQLADGDTVLIVHNIDLVSRIESLAEGDTVTFCGEYKWNDRGGLVHWTHADPDSEYPDGWLEHNGQRYE